jgi:hypothetical protein
MARPVAVRAVTGHARDLLADAEHRLATIADPGLARRTLTPEGASVQAQLALQDIRDVLAIRRGPKTPRAGAMALYRARLRVREGGDLTPAMWEALEAAGELEAAG